MKISKLTLAALLFFALGSSYAHAQDAGEQLNDAEGTSSYAASSDSRSNEDSSDNASASFDGQPSGSVEDPSNLQPRGTVVEPNSEE